MKRGGDVTRLNRLLTYSSYDYYNYEMCVCVVLECAYARVQGALLRITKVLVRLHYTLLKC